MFQKIFSSLPGKKKKTGWAKNHQSTFFDDSSSGWIFQKRKKQKYWGWLSSTLIALYKAQKWLVIFATLWCVIIIWIFLLFWPLLKIDEILVEQNENTVNINQIYDNIEYIRGKNLLLVDTQEISERIKKNQATISSVRTQKILPHTLQLFIESYSPLFQTDGYLIVENGSLVSTESIREDLPFVKVSEDLYETALFDRQLKSQDLQNILLLQQELSKNILGFTSKTLYFLSTEWELFIENSIGNIFIFDLATDIESQVRGLAIFSKEWGNVSEKKYVYIDVRIPLKLFLCEYDNEFSCRKNLKDIYGDTIFQNFPEETSLPEL